MAEIITNEEASVMVYGSAVVTFEEKKPKIAVNKGLKDSAMDKLAVWGDANDLPQQIITELEKNTDLGGLLDLQARVLYAGGITYELHDPETDELLDKKKLPEIDRFLKRNLFYGIQAVCDFYKFFNFFPQFTLTKNRKKIKWLIARPANFCRYSIQDSNGKVTRCYINADWEAAKLDDKETESLPVLNPILNECENLAERKDGPHFIYGMSYPTGKTYYSIPNWWGLKKSKWLELANKIPEFKLAVMNNQMTLKYHIQFPDYYWTWKFPDWSKMSNNEKKQKKEAEIKIIVDMLQGAENAGKTLVTGYKFDEYHGKEFPGIKIDAIDDKLKDGILLEDSVEATIKIFTALGLDPSILGIVPGKGGSNRSGSDKREALNIYISLIQTHADMLLRPLEFVSDYNGWNTDERTVKWRFKAPLLQTLDQITPSKRETKPEDDAN